MKLIINEMEDTEQNISKQHVTGEQSEIFLVKEVIKPQNPVPSDNYWSYYNN